MSDYLLPDLELPAGEREAALAKFDRQLNEWGLVMPDFEPLVVQFGLNDFWKTGLIEYWITNNEAAGYCGKFLFVFDGQTCPCHRHNLKDETFFIVKGKVKLIANSEEHILPPGATLHVRPGIDHSFTGIGNALVMEVSTPSLLTDNIFADERIGRDGVI